MLPSRLQIGGFLEPVGDAIKSQHLKLSKSIRRAEVPQVAIIPVQAVEILPTGGSCGYKSCRIPVILKPFFGNKG
jgi:hypothetical protein